VVKKYSENVILIVAYVVRKSDLDMEALRRYLKERLPDYMVPNHFEEIDEIPLKPSEKADRKALPEPVIQRKLGKNK
jgi:acyl-CoA synthetase (AMP-forming)/AMP-acid ligase II